MATKLRFDFPPEVVEERRIVYGKIQELLARQTQEAVVEARQLHLDWLSKHPDDYVALDAGEVLAMAESAYSQDEDVLTNDGKFQSLPGGIRNDLDPTVIVLPQMPI